MKIFVSLSIRNEKFLTLSRKNFQSETTQKKGKFSLSMIALWMSYSTRSHSIRDLRYSFSLNSIEKRDRKKKDLENFDQSITPCRRENLIKHRLMKRHKTFFLAHKLIQI